MFDILNKATQDPARYGHLVDLMDRTDRVDPAHIELRLLERQQEHAQRVENGCRVTDLIALANSGQRFGVVYADPAWDGDREGYRSAASHYPAISLFQQIAELPVARLLADDAALLMWVTGHHVARGNHVSVIRGPWACADKHRLRAVEETHSFWQRCAHRAGLVNSPLHGAMPARHQGPTATAGE